MPYLKEIAKHLGTAPTTLRRYFPTLCAQIEKLRRGFSTEELQGLEQAIKTYNPDSQRVYLSAARLQEIEATLKTYLENKDYPPTLKEMTASLQTTKETLLKYFPELFNSIRQQRIEYEKKLVNAKLNKVETALKEALNDDRNSTPFLSEISRKLGCDTHLLYRNFPDLCKEVAAKSRKSQRTSQQRRIQEACEEIKKIVLALSKEGVYPSFDRVRKQMSKPNYFLYPRVHEFWRNAVQSVGCSISKE